MKLDLESNLVEAFRSCVEVGADGLGKGRRAVLDAVAEGSPAVVAGNDAPVVTFDVPDHVADDLRSAFVVGWEGLETDDALFDASDEVARRLGVAPGSPAP